MRKSTRRHALPDSQLSPYRVMVRVAERLGVSVAEISVPFEFMSKASGIRRAAVSMQDFDEIVAYNREQLSE